MNGQIACAGILVADLVVPPLTALPESGHVLATDDFLLDSGGCAANTAIDLTRLGYSPAVLGRVGSDWFGDFVVDDLARRGVDTAGIARSRTRGTSKTVVLTVTGEDRRYIHTIGANADFTIGDLDHESVNTASVFYLGGFLVLPGLSADRLASRLKQLREFGTRIVLDVVHPEGEQGRAMDDLARVLPFVDVFMPNTQEAAALTSLDEPRRQAATFLSMGCAVVIITLGPNGALLASKDGVLAAPALEIEAVDQTGAGDAFAAGFIAGMIEKRSLPDSLRLASIVGASACRRLGCHAGVFTRPEVDEYLRTHPVRDLGSAAGPPSPPR